MKKRKIDQEPFMKNQTNLRFLLALGNTKIVVLEDQENLHIYSNKTDKNQKTAVAAERLTEALTLR